MLIFVSDLHLVDHPGRASFRGDLMFQAIRATLATVDVERDPVTLVLLGDIFELLKSSVWFEKDVRPWSPPNDELVVAALKVLCNIKEQEECKLFCTGLQALHTDFKVTLQYYPGNHDGLIDDMELPGLRSKLREMIHGLQGIGDERFVSPLVDAVHGVVAEHGHQYDGFNRRAVKSGRFVAGDALVIELLVGLPRAVAMSCGIDEFGPELTFLHEMDNVEPQSLDGLMRWLEFKMLDKDKSWKKVWEGEVSKALKTCGRRLRDAMKANSSEALARKAFWTLTRHSAFTRVSVLRKLACLPAIPSDEFAEIEDRMSAIEPTTEDWLQPPDVFVAGHTHAPLIEAFQTAKGLKMTYFNSGTWRRVYSPVRSLGNVAFVKSFRGALVCVHRLDLLSQTGIRAQLKTDDLA